MKTWQRLDESARPSAKAKDAAQMIGHMFHAFAVQAKYWKAIGSRRPGVAQFQIEGAKYPEYFVTLDEKGARVATGRHKNPTATWKSKSETFTALMRGEPTDVSAIALEGDLDLLDQLFRGLRAKI